MMLFIFSIAVLTILTAVSIGCVIAFLIALKVDVTELLIELIIDVILPFSVVKAVTTLSFS